MKGILIAGVFAAFAITAIDSLNCRQCPSTVEDPESCIDEATPCDDENAVSCVESSVNSTLGGSLNSYEHKFCSKINCINSSNSIVVSFTVRVSDDQQFSFASQCCQEDACPGNEKGPEEGNEPAARANTQIQCPSCYSNGTTDCKETIQSCSQGERCVHIIAVNGDVHTEVELKGCSNISEATCDILTPGNVTVGEFTFQTVNCTNEITTTTPTTVTTTPTTVTTTPDSSTSIKASIISSVFGSLLLLKLLF
uniref:ly6/PLAUR domain-containing protein 8-like n=1 Tax=Myodes glareolus TaxID=447135 RepID=UPI002020E464|nr:ly6/PLAUR domain-containing protein 8-like [Myodes glareolus]